MRPIDADMLLEKIWEQRHECGAKMDLGGNE